MVRGARAGEPRRMAREVLVEEVFGVVMADDGRTTHTLTTLLRPLGVPQGFGVATDDCDRTTHTLTLPPRLPQGFGAVADACEEAVVMEGTHLTTRITETLTIPHLMITRLALVRYHSRWPR